MILPLCCQTVTTTTDHDDESSVLLSPSDRDIGECEWSNRLCTSLQPALSSLCRAISNSGLSFSFAPSQGLIDDGSQAEWFVDGKAAFEAIVSSIESAKSEIYITGWWLCPELYLRRPFHGHFSSQLDTLLDVKAKQGVQIQILRFINTYEC